jgi:acyl carrier protein
MATGESVGTEGKQRHLLALGGAVQPRAIAAVDTLRERLYVADAAYLRRAHPARGRKGGNPRTMPSTFETVAEVITQTSDIPREKITPDAHAIDDLGIDSLDFLDIVFALDKKFGIKIPLEAWTKEVNEGTASVEDYFVLKNLCARIDELVAAKSA